MRVKQSGLGLCRAGDIADVAYLSSRAGAFDDCVALDRRHVWDDGPARDDGQGDILDDVVGEWLLGCVTQVNALLPPQARLDLGRRPEHTVKQGLLMELINKERHTQLLNGAGLWEKALLECTAAPHAGAWLDALPSIAFDMQLSNSEVQFGVGRRLGVPLCDEHPCPFCLGVVDKWGAHCESCMGGGDKTVNHNCIRDNIYMHSKRAQTQPRLEVAGVSPLLGLDAPRDTRERPADVLLCRAQDIHIGGGAAAGRIALDIGIIGPQAAGHLDRAAGERLGAAEEYVKTKCGRGDMETRCRQAGVKFQPLIFESLGGVSCEAERVIKSLNKAVAANTDTSEEVVATRFWQRLGIDLLRGNCRAFQRRLPSKRYGELPGAFSINGNNGLLVAPGV